jgi:nicotinamide riboside kinase
MKVINIFGGPGCGKSTTATGVFHFLKLAGHKVEYVSEYAKDVTWDRTHTLLEDYLHVVAEQHHRLWRLIPHKLDFAVVDSPLPVALLYMDEKSFDRYIELVRKLWNDYDNDCFILKRTKVYMPYGRSQTEFEAREKDQQLTDLVLKYFDTPVRMFIPGDDTAATNISNFYLNPDR